MRHDGDTRLDALVSGVVDIRRQIARLQARETRLLAAATELGVERMDAAPSGGVSRDVPMREIAAELAAAMRVSDRTVQSRMSSASSLASRFSETLDAWETGRIDAGHVAPEERELSDGRESGHEYTHAEPLQTMRGSVNEHDGSQDQSGYQEHAKQLAPADDQ